MNLIKQKKFSIITATFNRANLLVRLYKSLMTQSLKDFEWIIVDDGSIDDTQLIVEKWKQSSDFEIIYIYQRNFGKHRAINNGLKFANSTWTAIIDSDDWVSLNCFERVKNIIDYHQAESDLGLAGLILLSKNINEDIIGDEFPFSVHRGKTFNYYNKYKISGDKFDFYKTEVLKNYPFPEIPNEKFISEGIVWSRINSKYDVLFINEAHQYVEYQGSGLSASSIRLRINSPIGACLLYSESLKLDTGLLKRIRNVVNYYRFYIRADGNKLRNLVKNKPSRLWLPVLPFSVILFLFDEFRVK